MLFWICFMIFSTSLASCGPVKLFYRHFTKLEEEYRGLGTYHMGLTFELSENMTVEFMKNGLREMYKQPEVIREGDEDYEVSGIMEPHPEKAGQYLYHASITPLKAARSVHPEIVFTSFNRSYRMEFFLHPNEIDDGPALGHEGTYNEVERCPDPIVTLTGQQVMVEADFKAIKHDKWGTPVYLYRYADAHMVYEADFGSPLYRTGMYAHQSKGRKEEGILTVVPRADDTHLNIHAEISLNMTGLYVLTVGDDNWGERAGSYAVCIIQVVEGGKKSWLEGERQLTADTLTKSDRIDNRVVKTELVSLGTYNDYLHCIAGGTPKPKMSIYKDNELIDPSDPDIVLHSFFPDVTDLKYYFGGYGGADDVGMYRCEADFGGDAVTTVDIHAYVPVDGEILADLDSSDCSDVEVSCVIGGMPPTETAEFKCAYKKDGLFFESIAESKEMVIGPSGERVVKLTIPAGVSGCKLQCSSENKFDRDYISLDVSRKCS